MNKFNSVLKKIAIIIVIVVIVMALVIVDQTLIDHSHRYLIYDEKDLNFTGSYLVLPEGFEFASGCHLWPADEPLQLNGYWEYSTEFDQWIYCH